MKDRFDAVLFDMGYTLLGPHPSFEELVVETASEHGIRLEASAVRAMESTAFQVAVSRARDRRFTLDRGRSLEFWCGYYQVLLQHLGIADPRPALCSALYATFTRHDNYAFYNDVNPVLRRLRTSGMRLGVISNWENWLHDLLAAHEICEVFDCVIVSGTVGIEKPDPAIFHLAFDELAVLPQRCIYVGDSVEYDVDPARAVGFEPVLIDRNGRFDGKTAPCRRIRTLFELLEF